MNRSDNLRIPLALFLAVVLGFVALLVMTRAQWRLDRPTPAALGAIEAAMDPAEAGRYRDEQLAQMRTYRWIDKSKGLVAIPIDRAMAQVVRENSGR